MATLQITVPEALVPRVLTALRAVYPDLTAGLNNADAGRAVIRFWVRSTVSSYEGSQAAESIQDVTTNAVQAAWEDTEGIS